MKFYFKEANRYVSIVMSGNDCQTDLYVSSSYANLRVLSHKSEAYGNVQTEVKYGKIK